MRLAVESRRVRWLQHCSRPHRWIRLHPGRAALGDRRVGHRRLHQRRARTRATDGAGVGIRGCKYGADRGETSGQCYGTRRCNGGATAERASRRQRKKWRCCCDGSGHCDKDPARVVECKSQLAHVSQLASAFLIPRPPSANEACHTNFHMDTRQLSKHIVAIIMNARCLPLLGRPVTIMHARQ